MILKNLCTLLFEYLLISSKIISKSSVDDFLTTYYMGQ